MLTCRKRTGLRISQGWLGSAGNLISINISFHFFFPHGVLLKRRATMMWLPIIHSTSCLLNKGAHGVLRNHSIALSSNKETNHRPAVFRGRHFNYLSSPNANVIEFGEHVTVVIYTWLWGPLQTRIRTQRFNGIITLWTGKNDMQINSWIDETRKCCCD